MAACLRPAARQGLQALPALTQALFGGAGLCSISGGIAEQQRAAHIAPGPTAPEEAAAAVTRQRRGFVSSPPLPSSKAEDFDLIAPDVGLARIDGVGDTGFSVNNVQVEGAIMLSGDVFTLWRARSMADVTLDSLSLLRLLRPVPDLLVLGCGRRVRQLPPELARQLHDMGVRVDAMDTVNAVATFNVLNQEGRSVVGALLHAGSEE